MALFGGTPLSYAATFGLRRAVVLMLSLSTRSIKMSGLCDLNHSRRKQPPPRARIACHAEPAIYLRSCASPQATSMLPRPLHFPASCMSPLLTTCPSPLVIRAYIKQWRAPSPASFPCTPSSQTETSACTTSSAIYLACPCSPRAARANPCSLGRARAHSSRHCSSLATSATRACFDTCCNAALSSCGSGALSRSSRLT